MLNLPGYWLLLGVDSACATAAIRIQVRDDNLRWKLPLAFALCDGIGSFLGAVAQIGQGFDRNVASAIILIAYAAAIVVLLMLAQLPQGKRGAQLCRVIVLIIIPMLLSTDNLFVAKAFSSGWALAIFAATATASSYAMSLLGLAVGNAAEMYLGKVTWGAMASVTLFAIAWVLA